MSTETYEEVGAEHEWRDPGGIFRIFAILYTIAILNFGVLAFTQAIIWSLYRGIFQIDAQQASLIDQITNLASYTVAPVYWISAICTLVLTYRVTANARARGASSAKLTKPWMSVLAYFIPLASLFLPPVYMGQVWRASFGAGPAAPQPQGIIGIWWASFLVGNITALIARMNAQSPTGAADVSVAVVGIGLNVIAMFASAIAASLLLYIFGVIVKQQKTAPEAHVFE